MKDLLMISLKELLEKPIKELLCTIRKNDTRRKMPPFSMETAHSGIVRGNPEIIPEGAPYGIA